MVEKTCKEEDRMKPDMIEDDDAPRVIVDQDLVNMKNLIMRGDYLLGYESINKEMYYDPIKHELKEQEETGKNLSEVLDSLLEIKKAEDDLKAKSLDEFKLKLSESSSPPITPSLIHPDAVIIGAGPVGCWTALQLKVKGFTGKIVLYERCKEYKRNHMIKLPKYGDVDPRNIKVVELLNKKTASLAEIEGTLLNSLKGLPDIEIKYLTIDCLDSLSKLHPSNSIIFHCDGVHSKTRDLLFNKKPPITTKLFNVIQFSYKIQMDKVERLGLYKHSPFEKEYADKVFFIEQSGSGNTVTIRMFVNEILFQSVKNFTFVSPCDGKQFEESPGIKSSGLYQLICFYIKYRGFHTNERMLPNTFQLNGFILDCYKSECCGTLRLDDQQHFLVGDSAMGVPFYRSMRNGFVASNQVTNLVMGIIDEKHFFGKDYNKNFLKKASEQIVSEAYLTYDKFMINFYTEELSRAKAFTKAVSVKQIYSKVTSLLPYFLQVNKISDKERKVMNSIFVPFYEK